MSNRERCDEIVRLIDEVLGASEVDEIDEFGFADRIALRIDTTVAPAVAPAAAWQAHS